jgi:phosphatidylserine/phosphatidylglycerophosphate/cardiolipin synthase-like enzyme
VGKSSLFTGIILGLLLGAVAGASWTSQQQPDLKGEVSRLSAENAALETQVTSLEAKLKSATPGDFAFIEDSFSRTMDTSASLRRWISRANSTIRVAIYSFTSDPLGDALVAAKARGVDVRVYVENDGVSGSGSEYPKLTASGVAVKADSRSALMHHKFMVVDGSVVATGSYNWSASAEDSNDENLIVIRSASLAQDYTAEFNRLWAQGS